MPVEIKDNLNLGMDLDTSLYKLPKSAYLDAFNITRDAEQGSQDGVPTNIVGNQKISYNYPSTGKYISLFAFPLRKTILGYRYSAAGYDGIYEYSDETGLITKVFECLTDSATNILNFTSTGKITSVEVYPNDDFGDLMFFIDTLGRPTTLNITRFKSGEYTPVTREIIDLAKTTIPQTPECVYDNDTTRNVNNLRNKFFKFAQLPVFDDNEEATLSPQSSMSIPDKILSDTFTNVITNNNVIRLSLNSGPKNVKAIRLLVSYVDKTNEWSDFATVEVINKADNSITDDSVFAYSFYNDSTYPTYDPIRSVQLFDWIPTYVECMAMANGNTIELAGIIEEGLSREITPNVVNTILTVAAGNGGTIGTLNGVTLVTDLIIVERLRITFFGIPATGTIVNVNLITTPGGVVTLVGTYTTLAGDTSTDVAIGIRASYISIGIMSLTAQSGGQVDGVFGKSSYDFNSLVITPPAASAALNSFATWLWSTERNIAMQYFNEKGQTNGVLYNGRVAFPAYAENGSQVPLLPYINTKVYHVPPIWSKTYTFLFTKEPTIPLFWHTVTVNTTESDFLYFQLSILLNATKNPTTGNVLNYSFVDGDRMRLIRRMSDGTVYTVDYDAAVLGYVIDPKINNVATTGQFIKIKKVAPFSTVTYTTNFFVIEIYRPGQQVATGDAKNQTFHEFGEEFEILDAGTVTRRHAGQVTDQSADYVTPAEFNFYNGDSYFRSRTVPISETGVATFNVQDLNVVDFYISAVSSISGRPSLIDINQKVNSFPATCRFSQDIQPDTDINRLNRFLFDNFIDADAGFGFIKRVFVNGRQLEVLQELKIGRFPIFGKLSVDSVGSEILLNTNELLNPIWYYDGDFGIGNAKASAFKRNYAIFFCDPIHGAVMRLSKDGLTNLSEDFNFNSWATSEIPLRNDDNIVGCYDQKTNNYIFSLAAVTGSEATTRSFSLKFKSLESRLAYIPDSMCLLGTLLVSSKGGDIWTHDSETYNQFYNVKYPSSITVVWNENTAVNKSYLAVGYQSKDNIVWTSPENGDILTSLINGQTGLDQISQLKAPDYELEELTLNAGFLRDANSMQDARLALQEGDFLKGVYMVQKFVCPTANASQLVNIILPYITWVPSPRNF